MTDALTAPPPAEKAAAGKYLTFVLGRESYGIKVLKIREIIRFTDITPVPQMPEYVRGVINLRGKIIPVIDLRIRFGLAAKEPTEQTCIVVVRLESPSGVCTQTGLIVDAVEEVTQIAAGDIEAALDFGSQAQTDYILGMAKIKGTVKGLLDIDQILGAQTVSGSLRG